MGDLQAPTPPCAPRGALRAIRPGEENVRRSTHVGARCRLPKGTVLCLNKEDIPPPVLAALIARPPHQPFNTPLARHPHQPAPFPVATPPQQHGYLPFASPPQQPRYSSFASSPHQPGYTAGLAFPTHQPLGTPYTPPSDNTCRALFTFGAPHQPLGTPCTPPPHQPSPAPVPPPLH